MSLRETELTRALESCVSRRGWLSRTREAFGIVDKLVPKCQLTSFSILFARYKGKLRRQAILGAAQLNSLRDGDTVLISEGCTHHRQCGDIGTENTAELDSRIYRQRCAVLVYRG